ncbi:MAG: NUDIX hydrolase [Panacagrimonas sp.]
MNASWQPHIVVAAVVERDGRYLIVEERINDELRINQPAGHWEQGETLIEGLKREALEETAWDVEPTGFLGVYEWQPASLPYPFVRFAFVATALHHHADRKLDTGIERALWLTPDELQARAHQHRGPAVMQCIEDQRAGRIYPLSVIQHLIGPG